VALALVILRGTYVCVGEGGYEELLLFPRLSSIFFKVVVGERQGTIVMLETTKLFFDYDHSGTKEVLTVNTTALN
jgi:hypothetical protein